MNLRTISCFYLLHTHFALFSGVLALFLFLLVFGRVNERDIYTLLTIARKTLLG